MPCEYRFICERHEIHVPVRSPLRARASTRSAPEHAEARLRPHAAAIVVVCKLSGVLAMRHGSHMCSSYPRTVRVLISDGAED